MLNINELRSLLATLPASKCFQWELTITVDDIRLERRRKDRNRGRAKYTNEGHVYVGMHDVMLAVGLAVDNEYKPGDLVYLRWHGDTSFVFVKYVTPFRVLLNNGREYPKSMILPYES